MFNEFTTLLAHCFNLSNVAYSVTAVSCMKCKEFINLSEFSDILKNIFGVTGHKAAPFIIEPRHEKTCFSHMRITKAQISLRIRAV